MIAEFGTLVIYTIIIWLIFAFICEIIGIIAHECGNIRDWFIGHNKKRK